MNEMTIRLERNGAAAVPGGQLLLGYAGNRGNYRLRIEQRGEWKGLTVCALSHPRRKRSHTGGKRLSDRSGGGDGSARHGLHHF